MGKPPLVKCRISKTDPEQMDLRDKNVSEEEKRLESRETVPLRSMKMQAIKPCAASRNSQFDIK